MSDELDVERMLGEGCVNEARERAQGPLAHAKHHTHDGHGCSEDRQQGAVSPAEFSRLLCVVGVLTERLMAIAEKNDPGHEHVVELYDEELIRVSTRNLKMEADQVRRCIRLKVED